MFQKSLPLALVAIAGCVALSPTAQKPDSTVQSASPAPTAQKASPTPVPTPTPMPIPPMFKKVAEVPGMEVFERYSGITNLSYSGEIHSQWGMDFDIQNIFRTTIGDVRFLLRSISKDMMGKMIGCGACPDPFDNDWRYSGVFRMVADKDAFEIDPLNVPDTWKSWTDYYNVTMEDIQKRYKTIQIETQVASSSYVLDSSGPYKNAMIIRRGAIPSEETTIPLPNYFNVGNEAPSLATGSMGIYYISAGAGGTYSSPNGGSFYGGEVDGTGYIGPDGLLQSYTKDSQGTLPIIISRWSFTTKKWVIVGSKISQYLSRHEPKSLAVKSLVYSTSEKVFYILHKTNFGGIIYRVSEDALVP